jgi:hypothetical protein
LKKGVIVAAVMLVFSLVWMNRYVYVKMTGNGSLKVMRINRFTGRFQYTQMRGDGVWSDNINEHPKAEPVPTPEPIDLSAGLVPKVKSGCGGENAH